jgi:large subunit ribosomal protein L17
MRHGKAGRKFGRDTAHRRAMLRMLAGNLVLHERIRTTDAKSKELRRIADRMVTHATRLGDDLTKDVGKIKDEEERERVIARRVHAQRQVAKFMPKRLSRTLSDGTVEEVDLIHKLFHEIAPRYMERVKEGRGGGYTRRIKMLNRLGDNAPMTLIEFVGGSGQSESAEADAE